MIKAAVVDKLDWVSLVSVHTSNVSCFPLFEFVFFVLVRFSAFTLAALPMINACQRRPLGEGKHKVLGGGVVIMYHLACNILYIYKLCLL